MMFFVMFLICVFSLVDKVVKCCFIVVNFDVDIFCVNVCIRLDVDIFCVDKVVKCCFIMINFDVDIFWFKISVKWWMVFLRLVSLVNIFVMLVLFKVWKWLVSLFLIVNFNIVILLFSFKKLFELLFLFFKVCNFFVKFRNIDDVLLKMVDCRLFIFLVFCWRIFLICIIFCIRKINVFWWVELVGVVFCWLLMLFKRRLWIKVKCRVRMIMR